MEKSKTIAYAAVSLMFLSVFAGMIVSFDGSALTSGDSLWEYEVDINDNVKITKYLGAQEHVVVPDTINGKTVTILGGGTFSIDPYLGMKFIKSIDLPDTLVHAEANAIYDTGITTLHIPAGLHTCGQGPFVKNKNLKTITVSESNSRFSIFDGALYLNNEILILIPDAMTGVVELKTGLIGIQYPAIQADVDILLLDNLMVDRVLVLSSYGNQNVYFAPGTTDSNISIEELPSDKTLYTHYSDTVAGIPASFVTKEYAILICDGEKQFVDLGSVLEKPDDPAGKIITYYTDEDKTQEFDWEIAISEDTTLYTVMTNASDLEWNVTYLDGDGEIIRTDVVPDGAVLSANFAPVTEGAVYKWYADAGLTTLYDWDEPVTGHITIYGVASAVAADPFLSVMEIIILIGAGIIGILAIYTRNPYVALPAVILLVIAGLGYAGYIPLPEITVPGVNITLPTVNWPQINWPEVNLPKINWPKLW